MVEVSPGLELRERSQRRRADPEVGVGDRITVRVVRRVAERLVDPRLELLRKRMLEPVRLRVHALDRHAERLREVLLEQPVVADHLDRRPLPRRGQRDPPVRLVVDEAERRELLQHRRRRRRRNADPLGERRRRRPAVLGLELVDRLEVVLAVSVRGAGVIGNLI